MNIVQLKDGTGDKVYAVSHTNAIKVNGKEKTLTDELEELDIVRDGVDVINEMLFDQLDVEFEENCFYRIAQDATIGSLVDLNTYSTTNDIRCAKISIDSSTFSVYVKLNGSSSICRSYIITDQNGYVLDIRSDWGGTADYERTFTVSDFPQGSKYILLNSAYYINEVEPVALITKKKKIEYLDDIDALDERLTVVEDDLDVLKEQISGETSVEFTSNKIYKTASNSGDPTTEYAVGDVINVSEYNATASSKCAKVKLSGDITKIKIKTWSNSYLARPYLFIGPIAEGTTNAEILGICTDTTDLDVEITRSDIPEGAAYLLVNHTLNPSHTPTPSLKVLKSAITAILDLLDQVTEEFDDRISDCETELSKFNKTQSLEFELDKYVCTLKPDNTPMEIGDTVIHRVDSTLHRVKSCTVDLTQSFINIVFKGYGSTTLCRPYVIVDSDDVILEFGEKDGSQGPIERTLTPEDLPEGAATLYVNFWSTTASEGIDPYVNITLGLIESVEQDIKDYITDELFDQIDLSKYASILKGKKIICFGDSITEGVGNNVNGDYISWVDYLAEYFEADVTKMGVGGSHLTPAPGRSLNGLFVYKLIEAWYTEDYTDMDASINWAHSTSYGTRWDHVQYNIKNTSPTDYDVAIIAAGTNDWNGESCVLGDWNDASSTWNITVSLKEIIRMLQEMNPSIYILVIPPVPRYIKRDGESGNDKSVWDESTNFSDNYLDPNSELYLWQVSEKMNEVAKKCHTQSIESYWEAFGFNWDTWKLCTTDGTHLNDTGYRIMARTIGCYLASHYCR